jgi:hypothetical protein
MRVYIVTDPNTGVFLSVHRFMTDISGEYSLSLGAIRNQFHRKGYYLTPKYRVERYEV